MVRLHVRFIEGIPTIERNRERAENRERMSEIFQISAIYDETSKLSVVKPFVTCHWPECPL